MVGKLLIRPAALCIAQTIDREEKEANKCTVPEINITGLLRGLDLLTIHVDCPPPPSLSLSLSR